MEYDGGPTFPDPVGASIVLADPLVDNNVGANWCTSVTPFANGDLGTPGALNDSCGPAGSDLAVIGGLKFNDLNHDADRDGNEPGLSGWTMTLYNALDIKVAETTTAPDGTFGFSDLEDGEYYVCEVLQNSWTQSLPNNSSAGNAACAGAGEAAFGWGLNALAGVVTPSVSFEFGNYTDFSGISGVKWHDLNANGVKDNGEPGLSDWTITLNAGDLRVTAPDGSYNFAELNSGTYELCETPQVGWIRSFPAASDCQTGNLAAGGGGPHFKFFKLQFNNNF